MKRKAILAAALALLVVGCQPQSEFDRCMEVGTAIRMDFGDDEKMARMAAFDRCAQKKGE